jgi:DNA-binding CsgD family transcriptional regulator/type II secretory pathway predicted ATPase ExeA
VGRGRELARLTELIAGRDQAAVVAGPAGVGKTRLARESLRFAESAGWATAVVTATRAAGGIPLGALAPLLPLDKQTPLGAVDDQADLLRRSARALVGQWGGRRLVLMVDDAHLLDATSATVIHQLAAGGDAFILATTRSGEPAPDPIMALWKDGLAERIDLAGLDTDTIGELLGQVLDGPLDRALVAQMTNASQGNALFLRELVHGALEDGSLQNVGGIWRLVREIVPSLRLVELVEARLQGVSAAERCLLELLAWGEPLGRNEITSLAAAGVADTLEVKQLISVGTSRRRLEVRFAHGLYADVIRMRTSALRVPAISSMLADAVQSTGARRREDPLHVATWRLEAGGGAADLMLAAARSARWHYDFALSERLVDASLEAAQTIDALLLKAQLGMLRGEGRQAEKLLSALATQVDPADEVTQAKVALHRLDNANLMGAVQQGLLIADEVQPRIKDASLADEIASKRALLLMSCGPRTTAEVALPLLERAEGRALVLACLPACYALSRMGRLEATVAVAERGRAAHEQLDQPMEFYGWYFTVLECSALTGSGRLADSEARIVEEYRKALAERSSEAQAYFALEFCKVLLERGDVHAATRCGLEALALFREQGRQVMVQASMIWLAQAYSLAGAAQPARDMLIEFDNSGPTQPAADYERARAQAWMLAAAGDLRAACSHLEATVETGARLGHLVGSAADLHGLARLGRARDATHRLERLAETVEGPMIGVRAAHTRGLATQNGQALEESSHRFEELGALLLAAEAAADAAVAWHRRSADNRRTVAAARRSAELAGRCRGARTPALDAVQARSNLTQAERETALLASGGLSNKEIATRLHLSPRTVEGQLQRAYGKLGVSSRGELAEALHSEPGC